MTNTERVEGRKAVCTLNGRQFANYGYIRDVKSHNKVLNTFVMNNTIKISHNTFL